ncbi:FecCD family ABC transporter permease [Cellulomonas carbonis]|uniref:Iron ABC transporter permease n=1 Tax=Cellulomonas carbonis T26 TaxID=947969 RepID=A0A0A0BQY5_9CELL|nr:iron ABC transporter permease [Cellulomonas carbonis]KGM09514.1 iron ABC transporter permease [Cellulomonas carbonis T26]
MTAAAASGSPSTDRSARRSQLRSRARGRGLVVRGAVLAVVLVGAVAVSLMVGARTTSPGTVLTALLDPAALGGPTAPDVVVVTQLRIPRTVIGLLAGAALGLAGVVMQGVTRNPVADPGLLGINAGAAFAVVVGLSVVGVTSFVGLVGFALVGALAAATLVAGIAVSARTGSAPALLVVAGAAVTAGLTSLTTLVLLGDAAALDRYRFWTVGSLTGRDLDTALQLAPVVALGAVVALLLARALDALGLGDDVARGLGFRLLPTRAAAIGAIVLLCGSATALAGPLVFVGLLAAHGARALVGTRHSRLLPVAAVSGASVVVLADALGRVVVPPGELEVGIVVAALGAPLLIGLVRSRRVAL